MVRILSGNVLKGTELQSEDSYNITNIKKIVLVRDFSRIMGIYGHIMINKTN